MRCAFTPVCLPFFRLSPSRRRPSRQRQDRFTPIAPLVVSTGVTSASHPQSAMTVRPPRIRTDTVPEHRLIVPCPPSHRALSCCADLPQGGRPCMRFLFVGSQVCSRLPSAIFSRKYPCLTLVVYVRVTSHSDSATGDFHPISIRPCRAYTSHCT